MSKQTILYKIYGKGNPERIVASVTNIISKNNDKGFMKILISADEDDRLLCNEFFINAMKEHIKSGIVTLCYGKSKNKIHGMNRDIDKAGHWDILVSCPEDMELIAIGFDDLLRNLFKMNFADMNGVLHFNDGVCADALNLTPVIGRPLYDSVGHIYDPSYNGAQPDYGFADAVKSSGKSKYYNNIAFIKKQ